MKINRITAVMAIGLCVAACNVDDSAIVPLVELGTVESSYVLEADGGTVDLEVYSNGQFHLERTNDSDWLELSAREGSGDCTIKATASINEAFKRMTGIIFCSDVDTRRDTVLVKQKGMIDAVLSIENTSIVGAGAGGENVTSITTNIPFEQMTVKTVYAGTEADWIESISIPETSSTNRELRIKTLANKSENTTRSASITLSFTDGWGDSVVLTINYTQRSARELLGEEISFKDVRDFYATDSPITEAVLITGIVVSNTESGNAGENEQKTTSTIDYNGSKTTVYLESEDGKYGFALHTDTVEDNVFGRYDKVQVLLTGATVTRSENPERYDIKGISSSMVTSRVPGTAADVPVKEKHYSELTDDDVYTYVTMKDVEFPVRKGSLSPINEGYAIGGNANRISKFPILVRDINGDSFYLYTNTVCVYRNDGTRLPYGSGKMSGVLVHERFSRFTWKNGADLLDIDIDEELGNIGRYQLRHQSKEDIWGHMNDSVEDSFSALLTEYRFWNPDSDAGVQRPTYGDNGWFTHTYQTKYTGSDVKNYNFPSYGQHMTYEVNFSYLGPMGIGDQYFFGYHPGNVNGLGIVLDPEKDRYNPEMEDWVDYNKGNLEWLAPLTSDEEGGIRVVNGGSMKGKTWGSKDCFCSFSSMNWWDYDLGRGYAWMLHFSTEGISTDQLSLQISVMNTTQKFFSPRYWKVEWSEVDSMAPEDDAQWKFIAEYDIPDISVYSNTLYSSIVGYKPINFSLPLEMLGKENVYIRLIPASDICSNGADYANDVIGTETDGDMHSSAIDYIAIRYNK